jgi:hypothetical protein
MQGQDPFLPQDPRINVRTLPRNTNSLIRLPFRNRIRGLYNNAVALGYALRVGVQLGLISEATFNAAIATIGTTTGVVSFKVAQKVYKMIPNFKSIAQMAEGRYQRGQADYDALSSTDPPTLRGSTAIETPQQVEDEEIAATLMSNLEEESKTMEYAINTDGSPEMRSPLSNKRGATTGISPDSKEARTDTPRIASTVRNINMDGDEPMAMAMASAEVVPTQDGKKSRGTMAVYSIPRDMALFSQRAMVRLPLTINFSINRLDMTAPLVFKVCLNQYFNQFKDTSFATQNFPNYAEQFLDDYTGTTAKDVSLMQRMNGHLRDINIVTIPGGGINEAALGEAENTLRSEGAKSTANHLQTMGNCAGDYGGLTARSKGFSTDKAYDQLYINGKAYPKPIGHNYGSAQRFVRTTPCTTAGTALSTSNGVMGNSGDIQPDWRNFYEFMYQYRHVHKCKWAMIIDDPTTTQENNGVCVWKHETISNSDGEGAHNMRTNAHLHDAQGWPVKKQDITGGSIVNDTWNDSDGTADIVNEEDIREWYKTSTINSLGVVTPLANSPIYEENLVCLFYGKNNRKNATDGTGASYFNCRLNIEWHVEYRDIKREFRDITREAQNTARIGGTGQLKDIYPNFPMPVEGTDWPTDVETHGRACMVNYGTYTTTTK